MATQLTNWTKYQVPLGSPFWFSPLLPRFFARKIPSLPNPRPPSQQQPVATTPVIRTESRVVLVDAVVTDKKGTTSTSQSKEFSRSTKTIRSKLSPAFPSAMIPRSPECPEALHDSFLSTIPPWRPPTRSRLVRPPRNYREGRRDRPPDGVVDFGGSLILRQNFHHQRPTASRCCQRSEESEYSNHGQSAALASPVMIASSGMSSISSAESGFRRSHHVGLRFAAWRKIFALFPGRKMLILFSAGFPLTTERLSELELPRLTLATRRMFPSTRWTLRGPDGPGPSRPHRIYHAAASGAFFSRRIVSATPAPGAPGSF